MTDESKAETVAINEWTTTNLSARTRPGAAQ